MSVHRTRHRTIIVLAVAFVSAAGCQLDKLIGSPGNPLPPDISHTSIDGSAAVGSASASSIEIALTNPGKHAISWTASAIAASPWLTLDRSEGTAPTSLFVSLTPEQLTVGTHIDTIVIARADRPDVYVNLPVTYQIRPCDQTPVTTDTDTIEEISALDCAAPHRTGHFAKLYRIDGSQGDSVSILVESIEFDATLILAASDDPEQEPLLEQTTCGGAPGRVCAAYVALSDVNPLFIEITTGNPAEEGAFALKVKTPRSPDVPNSLGQFANQQGTPIPEGGTIPNNEMFVSASLFDVDPMDSIRLEIEVQPTTASFTSTPTHASINVPAGASPLIHVTDLQDDTGYKWQARTVDLSGRASQWVTFGTTPDDADFQVRVADAPHAPPYVGQFLNDQVTPVPPGGSINSETIVLAGIVIDSDENDLVRLEVEVRPVTVPFLDTPTASSVLLPSGDTARVVAGGLEDGENYHWQARAVDQNGLQGPWAPFRDTHAAPFDFRVDIRADRLAIVAQPAGGVTRQTLSPLRVEARKPNGAIDRRFNNAILVDLTPGTGTPGAVLSGTVVVVAKQGVAVFDDLNIDLAGANYRFTVLTAALPPILSAPFTVRDPLPTKLVILTQPSARAESGNVFAQQPVVAYQDEAGRTVGLNGLQVAVSIASGPAGELGGTTLLAADANGRVTFTNLAIKGPAGTYTLAFADPSGRIPEVISTPITLISTTDINPTSINVPVQRGR